MKGDWKDKIDYRKFTNEELEEVLVDLKYQLVIAKTKGERSAKVKGKLDRGKYGSDIQKRIRKEVARILTEVSRRDKEVHP